MRETANREGFWYSSHERHLPSPVPHAKPFEGQDEFLVALTKKEAKAQVTSYKGFSRCRICGNANGSEEYSIGGWKWPSGYRHYVEVHNVVPSPKFKAFITGQPKHAPNSWVD